MTHSHGHNHGAGAHQHRECSTPPPPPGTVDLEQMRQRAEAEARRKEELAKGNSDPNGAIDPVVELDPNNLEPAVVLRSQEVPVVVLIGGGAASDYTRMKTELTEMVRQANLEWVLGLVDADRDPQLAQAFGAQQLPTLVAVAGGSPIGQAAGEKTRDFLEQWINAVLDAVRGRLRGLPAGSYMRGAGESADGAADEQDAVQPPTQDPRLDEAEELLNDGEFDKALTVYDAILESEPANTELKAARTNVAFLARVTHLDRTVDHIKRSDDNPGDVDAAMAAADQYMAMGDSTSCLNRLLDTITATAGEDRAKAQKRLLEFFQMLDPADPDVLDARRRLASALF
ncbi:tetratricopeptide repeat protein [Corynebacterium sp. TAE3-ERU12]|uniref:tetratricopeptide repeat protein n=1 Tax=Corynebacterium sp. TAE3-ERU12 TaxID=2849491 RepID=UPI001C439D59|nr:tetratricopeptide repeat protein [Corynebacterium sp. TAE3-ERU12]MBV7295119.1 tetratricopeptide repeat protein [Corynebacterium sp. TAE3-ERU12]